MVIHDGVVWSRAVRQLPDRPGKLSGGKCGFAGVEPFEALKH